MNTDTPLLAKEWSGTLTLTSIGATSVHNPTHQANRSDSEEETPAWNSYVQHRKIIITKQEGRHIAFTVKGPSVDSFWVGTLSADGKEIVYLSVIGVMEPPVIVNIEPVMIEIMEPIGDRNYRASW